MRNLPIWSDWHFYRAFRHINLPVGQLSFRWNRLQTSKFKRILFRKTRILDDFFNRFVIHKHSLAYKNIFRKFTQFGLLLQEGELRPLRNGDRPLVVQSVEHAQPLGKAAVVGFTADKTKRFSLEFGRDYKN